MISMQRNIKPQILCQILITAIPHHTRIIPHKVQILINSRDGVLRVVDVPIDSGCESWEFGDEVEAIFECGLPVFGFLHSFLIGGLEFGVVVEGCDTHTELGHWVESLREPIEGSNEVKIAMMGGTYESTSFTTKSGNSPFSASSAESPRVCSGVGTSPVRRSQSILSAMISLPPGAGGKTD